MNIELNISLDMSSLIDMDGYPIGDSVVSNSVNILLSPIYATETDILRIFMDDSGVYTEKAMEFIFESSIKADAVFADSSSLSGMTPSSVMMIKREYVICRSIYLTGMLIFNDYIKSIKKSKFLAEIKVSADIEKDPFVIKEILSDAKKCYLDLERLAAPVSSQISSFVQGASNYANNRTNRQWMSTQVPSLRSVPYAEEKVSTLYGKYKVG